MRTISILFAGLGAVLFSIVTSVVFYVFIWWCVGILIDRRESLMPLAFVFLSVPMGAWMSFCLGSSTAYMYHQEDSGKEEDAVEKEGVGK